MFFYLDTSALLKRYVQETGSRWVTAQCQPAAAHTLATASITKVEATAALAAKLRHGGLTQADYSQSEQNLIYDFAHHYHVIHLPATLIDLAADLAKRQKLRGYDAVQLAAALTANQLLLQAQLAPLTLLSADVDLLQAAQNEGLLTDNPNLHP
jgi:uncharacterized protein